MPEDYNADTGEIVERFYRRSRELNELFSALAKAQSSFPAAERDGTGNYGKYATLESVLDATKSGREINNLAVIQMPGNVNGNHISVTTILGHSSGQWIESTFAVPPVRFDAPGAGSVVTYLRKYSLMAILGIAPGDDDGEAASIREPNSQNKAIKVASARTVSPKETGSTQDNSVSNGPPKWIADFLDRPSYEIPPKKSGSWSAWEKFYLLVTDHANDWDQLKKLETDNTGHIGDFRASVRQEVADHFSERIAENERRLARTPEMVP